MSPREPSKEGCPRISDIDFLLSLPILSKEINCASGKFPFTIFLFTQDETEDITIKKRLRIMIFIGNSKKNKLLKIYNKILEESKNIFFSSKTTQLDTSLVLELYQLNLIIILWYMRHVGIEKKYIQILINKFVYDIEVFLREIGESDSKVGRKTRKFIENFYGRLYNYSDHLDNLLIQKTTKNLKLALKKNFQSNKIDYNLIEKYIKKNAIFFGKLKPEQFWELSFNFQDQRIN